MQLFVTPEMIATTTKDNKSPGVDGILQKLHQEIIEQISTPLAKVFFTRRGNSSSRMERNKHKVVI